MEKIKVALTEKRYVEGCECYLFPDDVFDVPGFTDYSCLEILEQFAEEELRRYQNQSVILYINGGLAIETTSVVKAAAHLNIKLQMAYYNNTDKQYFTGEFFWKNTKRKRSTPHDLILCDKRHVITQSNEGAVFGTEEDILDVEGLQKKAEEKLKVYQNEYIRVYVTGLTQFYIAVLNAAETHNIAVDFLHYNSDLQTYMIQMME